MKSIRFFILLATLLSLIYLPLLSNFENHLDFFNADQHPISSEIISGDTGCNQGASHEDSDECHSCVAGTCQHVAALHGAFENLFSSTLNNYGLSILSGIYQSPSYNILKRPPILS